MIRRSMVAVAVVLVVVIAAFAVGMWWIQRSLVVDTGPVEQILPGQRSVVDGTLVEGLPAPMDAVVTEEYTATTVGPGYFHTTGEDFSVVMVVRVRQADTKQSGVNMIASGRRMEGEAWEQPMKLVPLGSGEYIYRYQANASLFPASMEEVETRYLDQDEVIAQLFGKGEKVVSMMLPMQAMDQYPAVDEKCNVQFYQFLRGETAQSKCEPTAVYVNGYE